MIERLPNQPFVGPFFCRAPRRQKFFVCIDEFVRYHAGVDTNSFVNVRRRSEWHVIVHFSPRTWNWPYCGCCGTSAPGSVRQVHKALTPTRSTGYSTTLKMMQVMLEKGVLTHDAKRPQLYAPAATQAQTQLAHGG